MLLQEYGHQVRLASHVNFRDFVKKEGLEFYPLGGDPKVLAECRCPFWPWKYLRKNSQTSISLFKKMRNDVIRM